jgi:hypothetical protein
MAQVKVLVNDGASKRKEVEAELLQTRATTLLVRLPDGKVITRKKKRDLPNSEVSNGKA